MKMRIIVFCCLLFVIPNLFSQSVGIGTDDPDPNAKLEISAPSSTTEAQLLLSTIGNNYARSRFSNTNSSNYWEIGGYVSTNSNNDLFQILNNDTGKHFSITGRGKVGIGPLSANSNKPKADFHVSEDYRVLFGADTTGAGYKLMFLPDLHAFRVGTVSSGSSSSYWNRDSIGYYSFASGRDTRAQGFGATAMGSDTEATNDYAFASGYFTNADGQYSTAMGFASDAFGQGSTSLGYLSRAIGDYTFAAGLKAYSVGKGSTSIGHETLSESFRSVSLGTFNVGNGDGLVWIDDDPILEVGIGRSEGTRENALTILKDGRHGILTNQPKASLHVKDDGIIGSGTIVAILEADVSDRPILQFSETANGDANSGMSIEYDGSGSGSNNKMYINDTNGSPTVTFESGGGVGIITTTPKANLHVKDDGNIGSGTIVAVLEANVSDRPILQFAENPNGDAASGMSIEYDGSGSGTNNKMHINGIDGSPKVTFESGGQVGIGVASPTYALHLPDNSVTGKARAFSWTTYSDKRIKSNITALPYGLQSILLLRPVIYNQHNSIFANSELSLNEESTNTIGLLAQEVHEVIPEAVIKPEDENEQLWGMDYDKLIPVLIKGMQEQQEQIDALKEEIKVLNQSLLNKIK